MSPNVVLGPLRQKNDNTGIIYIFRLWFFKEIHFCPFLHFLRSLSNFRTSRVFSPVPFLIVITKLSKLTAKRLPPLVPAHDIFFQLSVFILHLFGAKILLRNYLSEKTQIFPSLWRPRPPQKKIHDASWTSAFFFHTLFSFFSRKFFHWFLGLWKNFPKNNHFLFVFLTFRIKIYFFWYPGKKIPP